MTKSDMNSLRPMDKIVFKAANTITKGMVKSVWRDDRVQVKWSDGTLDSLEIDDANARMITLVPLGRPQG